MKLILLAGLLLSFNAMAKTYIYDIVNEDDTSEKYGMQVEVKLDGEFKKGSKITSFKVTALKTSQTLFYVGPKDISNYFNVTWTNQNTLYIQGADHSMTSSVQKAFHNYYGDAPIQRGHEYYICGSENDGFNLTKDGTGEYERFEVSNQTQGEMAIWGGLKINSIK